MGAGQRARETSEPVRGHVFEPPTLVGEPLMLPMYPVTRADPSRCRSLIFPRSSCARLPVRGATWPRRAVSTMPHWLRRFVGRRDCTRSCVRLAVDDG
jgi:hypothetical protein